MIERGRRARFLFEAARCGGIGAQVR